MKDKPKLFKVKTKGHGKYSLFYVVATDPTAAYHTVREWLDEKNLGFTSHREMDSVTLIAEAYEYTNHGMLLIGEMMPREMESI